MRLATLSQSGPFVTRLHNHLRDTLAAEGLASNKSLAPDGGEEVADSSKGEDNAGCDQAGGAPKGAEELNQSHDGVGGGTGVVSRNLANRGIKAGRGGADSKEKGDFDEENDEGRCKAEGAEDNDDNIEGENVGNSQREAENHGQYTEPLAVDTEIPCRELFLEGHFVGI